MSVDVSTSIQDTRYFDPCSVIFALTDQDYPYCGDMAERIYNTPRSEHYHLLTC